VRIGQFLTFQVSISYFLSQSSIFLHRWVAVQKGSHQYTIWETMHEVPVHVAWMCTQCRCTASEFIIRVSSTCRSPCRYSHASRTAHQATPRTPPVNAQSWAAANSQAIKSNRYQKLAVLHLAPNVAIRPDHGSAWDINEGTHNTLISDDTVDNRALQVCARVDPS
jgi:hypothetical protein